MGRYTCGCIVHALEDGLVGLVRYFRTLSSGFPRVGSFFGVAGVGRRGVILKVINNIAKTHAGSLDPVIGRVGVCYK